MTDPAARPQIIELDGAYNIRDLGGYRTRSGARTRFRRVLRADATHRLTRADVDTLLGRELRTVIDLRAPHEVRQSPSLFAGLDGLDYRSLPLFDALSPEHIEARDASRDPLLPFYFGTLESRGARIAEVLQAIAEARPGAVMFNCTAGKDRTGLISALLLGNADVVPEEIVEDYALTEPLISGLVDEFMTKARASGRDLDAYRRVLRARPETMMAVLDEIAGRYGSVSAYLEGIGLRRPVLDGLSRRLLAA